MKIKNLRNHILNPGLNCNDSEFKLLHDSFKVGDKVVDIGAFDMSRSRGTIALLENGETLGVRWEFGTTSICLIYTSITRGTRYAKYYDVALFTNIKYSISRVVIKFYYQLLIFASDLLWGYASDILAHSSALRNRFDHEFRLNPPHG